MSEKTTYFVLKEKAVPEVLRKVVEAKRLIESGRCISVQEATDRVGISRSSFYKYKEDIFPFHDNVKGKTITMVIQLEDEPRHSVRDLTDSRPVSCQHTDDPPEYSGQWDRVTDLIGRCAAGDRRCLGDGGSHGKNTGNTIRKNIS